MKNHFQNLLTIIVMTTMLFSCASQEEPQKESDDLRTTRSAISDCHSLSKDEVLIKASAVLNKKAVVATQAKVQPVMAQKYLNSPMLLSDTIAYIVNYNDNAGFAVVANDSRVDEVLAYSDKGSFSYDNPIAKAMFLDKIEGYLHSLSSGEKIYSSTGTINAPTRHLVIDPQINIEIGPTAPFDKIVTKYHPVGHTGFQNVAAATIISHLKKTLTYHNYYYNFESINYALNQGNGFNPALPGIEIIKPLGHNIPPLQFQYSYNGSVDAYSQLLYNLGQDTKTIYNQVTFTLPDNTRQVLNDIGLEVSPLVSDKNINDICSLLYDENLVLLTVMFVKNEGGSVDIDLLKGPVGWVIDGCDVILNKEGSIESGMVHCVWGLFGLGDGFYSYPILLMDDEAHVVEVYHFGAKEKTKNISS